jgi:hypothetical protein
MTKAVAIFLRFVPPLIFIMWYTTYKPPDELAGLVAIGGLFLLIPTSILLPRRFARLRRAEPDEKLLYPLEQQADSRG